MPSRSHGGTGTRLHQAWQNMKARCYRKSTREYCNYGGRGISICDEWLNSFEPFKEWALSNGYKDDLTLDRIDNNGNYEPSNCRWITNQEQQHNKRTNRLITFNGITKTLTQWAKEMNLTVKGLETRLDRCGWNIEKALTTPTRTSSVIDLTGQTFGRWKVIGLSKNKTESKAAYWKCVCQCGTVRDVKSDSLRGGRSKSCGCLAREQARKLAKKYWESKHEQTTCC